MPVVQKRVGVKVIIKNKIIQDLDIIFKEGSKIENRFIIILSVYFNRIRFYF